VTSIQPQNRSHISNCIALAWPKIALVLLGTVAIFTPTLASFGASIQMDGGDSLLNLLFLENGYIHLWGGEHWLHFKEWLNPGYFYPYANVLAWSDHAFIPSAFYAILRRFVGPIGAYNLWMMLTAAINFLVFSAVLQHFARPPIALTIAFATNYGLIQLSQLGHSQLLTQWFIAPCLLCVYEGTIIAQQAIHQQIRLNPSHLTTRAIRCALLIIATFLCSYYLFYMLILSSLIIIGASAITHALWPVPFKQARNDSRLHLNRTKTPQRLEQWGLRQKRRRVIDITLLTTLLVPSVTIGWAYIGSYRLHGGRELSLYPFERPDSFQPWLTTTFQSGDLLIPPPVVVDALRDDITNLAENGLFNGYVYLACFFLGLGIVLREYIRTSQHPPLLRQRQNQTHFVLGKLLPDEILAGSLIFYLASLGIGLVIFEVHHVGLWQSLFSKLPGASAIRAISRFGFLQLYLSSIAMAFAFEYYCQSFLPSRQLDRLLAWLTGIAIAISFVNGMGAHPFANITNFFPMVRTLHQAATQQKCDVVYLHAGQFNPLLANALALQPAPHLKVVNGYSGWASPLATKLDALQDWQPNSLRKAVEPVLAATTMRSNQELKGHLNFCHIEAGENGKDLIFNR